MKASPLPEFDPAKSIPYGSNPELDALYEELGAIEEKEIHHIEAGMIGRLPEIRESMLPLKAKINAMEGMVIYPEAYKPVVPTEYESHFID